MINGTMDHISIHFIAIIFIVKFLGNINWQTWIAELWLMKYVLYKYLFSKQFENYLSFNTL